MSYKTDKIDNKIAGLLKDGKVGLLPSDTIYGLSCLALNEQAVQRVHSLKGRAENKPYVILISETSQLELLGIISTDAAPALRYWPGKLTLICDAPKAPSWLHMGLKSLAVRQPDVPELRDLIAKTGPIISTSANLSGKEPAQNVDQAHEYFNDHLDFYVDFGELDGQPSTIVKSSFHNLEILRQGAVKIKQEGK